MSERNPTVLVICSANICRSPVVEALLREGFRKRNVAATVESAGTLGIVGEAAAGPSIALMKARGSDLSGHRSSALEAAAFERADLVVCMAQNHVDTLLARRPDAAAKVVRLAELAGERRDVVDPYGGPLEGYERMVDDVVDLCERAWPAILRAVG